MLMNGTGTSILMEKVSQSIVYKKPYKIYFSLLIKRANLLYCILSSHYRVAVLQEQQPVMVNQMVSSLQQEHQQQILAAVEKARREEKVSQKNG